MSAMTLQLNKVSAESDTGIKFLANIINRGDAVLPAYSEGVTDKSVVVWLEKVYHTKDSKGNIISSKELGNVVADRLKAKPADKVYHITLSDVRIELTEKSKPEQSKDGRVFQSIDIKMVSGCKVSGGYTDRLVIEVGDL